VVARGEQSTALALERVHAGDVARGERRPAIDPQKPHLVEPCTGQAGQHLVITLPVGFEVAGQHLAHLAELLREESKSADVPVVLGVRDAALQENVHGRSPRKRHS
jgi:hypothetical protein